MSPMIELVFAAGVLNLLVGVAYTLVVYRLLEKVPMLAMGTGLALAAVIIVGEARLGEQLLSPTWAEMKLLVMAAVLGAIVGIVGITTVFKPKTTP